MTLPDAAGISAVGLQGILTEGRDPSKRKAIAFYFITGVPAAAPKVVVLALIVGPTALMADAALPISVVSRVIERGRGQLGNKPQG